MNGASFGIVGCVNKAAEAGMDQRAGAHSAGFDGDVELAIEQTMVAEGGCPLPEGDYFGMGGGVGIQAVAVEASAHNPAFANQNCPHRYLAGLQGKLGLLEGLFHPEFIRSSIHAPNVVG